MAAKPSRVDFLDQVEYLIKSKFPLVKLERSEPEFAIRINGHWTRLENLYRLHIHAPENLEEHVNRWVVELLRAAEGSPDQQAEFEDVKDRILPMVLSDAPRDVAGLAMIKQKLLNGLNVAYAIDSERTIAYIPQKLFDLWNISLDELHETAIDNLVKRSDSIEAYADPDDDGRIRLILIQTRDGYDASRLLLPSLHERMKEHLGTPFLAAIPNRDILICFRQDTDSLSMLEQQVKEDYRTMPHQITDHLFLVTADGLANYDPATL